MWKRTIFALTLFLATTPFTHAQTTFYNNQAAGNRLFTNTTNPAFVLDDFTLAPGTVTPGANTALLTAVNLGYVTYGTATTNVTATVRFYDDVNFNAADTDVVNTGYLGGFTVDLGRAANGAHRSNIGISGLSGGGISLTENDNLGISIAFTQTGTNLLSNDATILFNGGPVATGSSQDVYWQDTNADNTFTGNEGVFFGGGTALANFDLSLSGIIQPTPAPAGSASALIGLGVLAIAAVARRRHANA